MENIEDFKYEFDLACFHFYSEYAHIPIELVNGYICLHQFILQDLSKVISKEGMVQTIKTQLEEGETIEEISEDEYIISINNLCEETVDYIKFLLKYSLVKTKNLRIENNTVKFEIDNEDLYQRK